MEEMVLLSTWDSSWHIYIWCVSIVSSRELYQESVPLLKWHEDV